jgi:predicted amino acid-binding ACT domain protein
LKVEGNDAPGLGFRITSAIAESGVNLRGFSGAVVGRKFVAYLGFDGKPDADKAARALKALASTKKSGSAK